LNVSQNRIGRDINVSPRRINEIVLAKRSITADTALRLGRYFNMSERFWLGLQDDYDLEEARKKLGGRLCVFRSKTTTDSAAKWATCSGANWASHSAVNWATDSDPIWATFF
jgi:addiction module HigA family antidote